MSCVYIWRWAFEYRSHPPTNQLLNIPPRPPNRFPYTTNTQRPPKKQVEAEIEAITPLHSIGALLLNTSSLKGSLKVRVCVFVCVCAYTCRIDLRTRPSPFRPPHPTTNHNHESTPQGECRQWKLRFAANLHVRAKDDLERLTEYIRVRMRVLVGMLG